MVVVASIRYALRAPGRSAVKFHTDFVVRRSQQRRVPQQSSGRRWLHQINPPAETSTDFSRDLSSAISGFRSLCGRKQRSSLSHRAQLDLRFGTFHSGRALALRTLAFNPLYPQRASTGPVNPGPMLCRERSRSRAIFQAVFSGFIRAISAPQPPAGCPPDRLWGPAPALTLPRSSAAPHPRFGLVQPPLRGRRRTPATVRPAG
jgi:hypothetical protein